MKTNMNDIKKNAKELVTKAKAKNLIQSYTVAFKDFPVNEEVQRVQENNCNSK